MDMEIKNAVSASDTDAQYDEKAKRLLGNKMILAHILVKTVDEFLGMDPEEAVSYIEGDPFISAVPLEPGLTNVAKEKDGQRVVGLNTENTEINEGMIRFDIIFYVRMKDGISQVIVNIEAQKGETAGYRILNRAVFYVSRLISSQKERDFVKMNYDDIRRVYSIWVCMGMDESSMAHVHLAKDDILGSHQWEGGLDLLNIVMVGISDELPKHDDKYELHRLLSATLSMDLSVDEKLGILETEYGIPLDDKMREEVVIMCNLSQGIREKGRAEGRAEGEVRFILNMYHKGYSLEQIADVAGKSMKEVDAIIEGREPVLA